MKPSEVLDGAIGHIKENGWCRYELQNDQGQFCVLGAANKVVYGMAAWQADEDLDRPFEIIGALRAVVRIAHEARPTEVLDTPFWREAVTYNNDVCEDQSEMLATMEKARAQLQEAGQ